jgi:hypothetical protein
VAAPATRGARPAWCGANEWAGRLDGRARADDVLALYAAGWWCVPGPDLPPPALDAYSRIWWAAHQVARRN